MSGLRTFFNCPDIFWQVPMSLLDPAAGPRKMSQASTTSLERILIQARDHRFVIFGPQWTESDTFWTYLGTWPRTKILIWTEFVDKINDKLPNERLTIHRSPRWQKSYHRQLDQVEGSVTWFFNFWTHKRSLSRGRTQNQVLDPLPSSGTLHEDNRKRCCCIRHKNFWCSSIIFLVFDRLF